MMTDDERKELESKLEELFEAAGKKDWGKAADAFEDAQALADDDSPSGDEEPKEDDKGEKDGKGKPLAALIFGKK